VYDLGVSSESAAEVRSSRAGDCIDARYRLESEIGSGALGAVYRATQTKLSRAVAVKLLNESMGASDVQRARFEREAKALASLEHPNIVSVLDYGVADGQPYLVMELLEGETLAQRVQPRALQLEAALRIARELLSALAFMHGHGVVHRDLKPSNVFLQRVHGGERVKVLDFGLAKNTGLTSERADATLTRDGTVVGTPAYMSPEQATGDMVDTRSDVYSLGVLLFQMLSGRLPFEGDAIDQVRSHLVEPVPALARAEPIRELDAELEKLIWRAMAKRREDRFANASEMRDELNAIISRHQNSAGVPLMAAGRDSPSRPSLRAVLPTAARLRTYLRRTWLTFLVTSVLGFSSVVALVVLLLRDPGDRRLLGQLGGRAYQRVNELATRSVEEAARSVSGVGAAPEGVSTVAQAAAEPRSPVAVAKLISARKQLREAVRAGRTLAAAEAEPLLEALRAGHAGEAAQAERLLTGVRAGRGLEAAEVQQLVAAGGELPLSAEGDEPAGSGPPAAAEALAPGGMDRAVEGASQGLAPGGAQTGASAVPSDSLAKGVDGPGVAEPSERGSAGLPTDSSATRAVPNAHGAAAANTPGVVPANAPGTPAAIAPGARPAAALGRDARVFGPPGAQNPWSRALPRELRGMQGAIFAGGVGNEKVIASLREYTAGHADDVRGRLLLAQLYVNRGARAEAVAQLSAALQSDLSARGAPEVLRNLLAIVVQGKGAVSEASRLIVRAFGSEALPSLDARLAATKDPEAVARLRALRARIKS